MTIPTFLLLLTLPVVQSAPRAAAPLQDGPAADCPPCEEASARAADGDTAGAIALLQEATAEDAPAEAWGELGLLLTRMAPALASDFTPRQKARNALERALDAQPDNPRWLYAYGLLLRKQGVRVDARRVFDRALSASANGKGTLDSTVLANIYAEQGRILEEHVLDFRGLITGSDRVPVATPDCIGLGAFCLNFRNPRRFHDLLLSAPTADDVAGDDRERMRIAFERAFDLDPSLPLAARGWLGELARQQDWTRFSEGARRHVEASGGTGWSRIFLGAGFHRLGRPEAADSQFRQALEQLPPADRSILEDISQVVTSEVEERYREMEATDREPARNHFWTLSDPLYLTDTNERFLEHLTRTALAELWFGVPAKDLRGYQTERGVVLIRYGTPRTIRQVVRSQEAVRSLDFDTGGGGSRLPKTAFGGRWILWTYSDDSPSFIFEKHLTSRHAPHALRSRSMFFAQDLRERQPSRFELENFETLPHQIARFKGDESEVEAEIHAAMPTDSTEPAARAGLFFLPQSTGAEVTRLTTELTLADTVKVATFRAPLAPGSYPFSIEAAADDGSVRAASRGTIEAEPFSADRLSLSDVLLARGIQPRTTDGQVQSRRDLVIRPAADLTVRQGEPVALYFEIYGLAFSDAGEEDVDTVDTPDLVGSYTVRLEVSDARERNVLARVLAGIEEFIGGEPPDGAIEWERTLYGATDRVPEWLEISLADREPGSYRVQVTVTDLQGEEVATIEREFEVVAD